MPCIHSDIAFQVQVIKPLVLAAPHSSLVHNSNSLVLIGPFFAVSFLPFLLARGNTAVGK